MAASITSARAQWRYVALILTFGAFVVAEVTIAQPRSEPEVPPLAASQPVTEPAAMGEWLLQRLVGKFKYEGSIYASGEPEAVKGSSDCVAIGDGPGIQCVLNVTWIDQYPLNPEAGVDYPMISYLDPAMELFGLDPQKGAISHLVVNNKGMPEGGLGFIKGDVATFKMPCVNTFGQVTPCIRVIRIEAKLDSSVVWMWFGKVEHEHSGIINEYATMTLRRMPPDWDGAPRSAR